MQKFYTAALSRNQGRGGWSVIFRHPTRRDTTSGKAGRRIRRGLGTSDDAEASQLVEQLNELLRSPELWEPAARVRATDRYDARVVDIFYEGAEASRLDFAAIRNEALVLPDREDGYQRVMLLGTTGAGKTTVVRQLLGTDPERERFPSTSTAKTTVADTEIVVRPEGSFAAVVTFVPREEVVDYLTENVVEAALAVFNERDDAAVIGKLLDHVDQRFRFSYVLGRGPLTDGSDDDDDDVVEDDNLADESAGFVDLDADWSLPADASAADAFDPRATEAVIEEAVLSLHRVVDAHVDEWRDAFEGDDERVVQEIIEEELESVLRQSEEFHVIVDRLSDEIEKRFSTLTEGEMRRNRQGWPISWTWETGDRKAFISGISRFTSNRARLFGRLLTPLVNGIRVAGPFAPDWAVGPPRLVLIDGEGLGHTPKSAATLSTAVVKRLDSAEAILLVDNATQPMQAAPTAAIKSITVSGHAEKLYFVFTHFDQVTGDNLPTFSSREDHVLASVNNVLKAIGDDLGPQGERALRERVDVAKFFVGGIQENLDPEKRSSKRTIGQLRSLLESLMTDREQVEMGPSKPVYDRMNLSLAVAAAAESFHTKWRALLGLESNPAAQKEHWARVKALSRRLAGGWADEYDDLKPISDLRNQLQEQIYNMLQRPVRWENGKPDDDTERVIIAEISKAVTRRLLMLSHQRLAEDRRLDWEKAYEQRGVGSTFVRARIIAEDVYVRGAPVPGVVASPDQNEFLKAVAELLGEVADELHMDLV